jgi:hypothetical protein
MTDHPITPPPELVQQWRNEEPYEGLLSRAAQWGADQELEACCEWIAAYPWLDHPELLIKQLRAIRRPKPPSLKEQALAVIENSAICDHLSPEHAAILRRALEQLDD